MALAERQVHLATQRFRQCGADVQPFGQYHGRQRHFWDRHADPGRNGYHDADRRQHLYRHDNDLGRHLGADGGRVHSLHNHQCYRRNAFHRWRGAGDGSRHNAKRWHDAFDSGNETITSDTLSGAGTIGLEGGAALTATTGIANGGNLLTVNSATTGTVAGVISGAGALTKTGAGTVTLTSANTYTGNTNVNGGTLSVNGSVASSANVFVNNGGTLGGKCTVSNLFVGNGGHSCAGNSIGTLTVMAA